MARVAVHTHTHVYTTSHALTHAQTSHKHTHHTCTHITHAHRHAHSWREHCGHSCSQPQPGTLLPPQRCHCSSQAIKAHGHTCVPSACRLTWTMPAIYTVIGALSPRPRPRHTFCSPILFQGKLGRIGPPGCKGDPGSRVSMALAPFLFSLTLNGSARLQVGVGKLGVPELGFFLQPCLDCP